MVLSEKRPQTKEDDHVEKSITDNNNLKKSLIDYKL
jgi:hypothetical protein